MNTESTPTNPFKIGDIVILNSGGPRMTVADVEDDLCSCVWFLGTEHPEAKPFPAATLTIQP